MRRWTLFAFSLVVSTLPAQRSTQPPSLVEYAKASVYEQAYGVYMAKAKVGWMVDSLHTEKQADELLAVRVMTMQMSMTMLGETHTMQSKMRVVYSTRGGGHIVRAETTDTEDGSTIRRVGKRVGDGFVVETFVGGERRKQKFPLPRDTLAQYRKNQIEWFDGDPKPKARVIVYGLTMDAKKIDEPMRYTFLSKEKAMWGGVPTKLIKARSLSAKMSGESLLLSPWVSVRHSVAGGVIRIQAEEEAVAKAQTKGVVDVGYWSQVAVDRDLGDNAKLQSLVLEMQLPEGVVIPETHRQRVEKIEGEERVRLILKRGHRRAKPDPLTDEKRKEFLAEEPGIEVGAAEIQARAKALTKDAKTTREKAQSLQNWIYLALKKSYSQNSSSAVVILKRRAGDCTEHARLFVALARASGLPARELGGLIYAGEGYKFFAWHAWAEFHDGHQWTAVDPAWGQLPVDPTHIRFATDHAEMSWVHALGKLSFSVEKLEKLEKPGK